MTQRMPFVRVEIEFLESFTSDCDLRSVGCTFFLQECRCSPTPRCRLAWQLRRGIVFACRPCKFANHLAKNSCRLPEEIESRVGMKSELSVRMPSGERKENFRYYFIMRGGEQFFENRNGTLFGT